MLDQRIAADASAVQHSVPRLSCPPVFGEFAPYANLMGFVTTLSDREKEAEIPSPSRAARSSLASAST